jgi:hypothetical protein
MSEIRRADGMKPMLNQFAGGFRVLSLINVEENFERIVGRRTGMPNGLSTATSSKADSIAWRNAFGGVRVPRGVHRFTTHEEADEWLWRMITRPRN